jgi:TonB family protein
MRLFRFAFVLLLLVLAPAASAQTPASAQTGPSPRDVVASPKIHAGARVSWVVRFRSLLLDFAPNRAVENDRVVYEWRDETGAWSGQFVIGPPVRQTRWTDAAIAQAERMFQAEPRLVTGIVSGVETANDANGKPYMAVVLDTVTVDVVPLTPKTRITGPGFAAGAYAPGQGVTWPEVVREMKPTYPQAALGAKIEGSVELEIVVLEDGTVGDVRVTKSLDRDDYGFAKAAIEAAKQWKFKPGLRDGVPVRTRVGLVLAFKVGG